MTGSGRHRAAVLLAACLLTGCAGVAGGPAQDVPPDLGGTWELVEGTGVPQPDSARATLVFGENSLSGRSFCNAYGGTYRMDGSALTVDGLGGTEMACDPPEIMVAETSYLAALGAGGEIAVEDGSLVLTGEDSTLRFRLLPPVPTSELTGTEWVLDTLVQGEVVSSVMQPSALRFDADGTFHGATACRVLSGTWTTDGDAVSFPELVVDERDCPAELRAQDEHEGTVLGNGFRIEIAENRLTATGPDGLGLVYRDWSR